jgi:very-short-patch-repair endonuclease
MPTDDLLRTIAEHQHGLVRRDQARSLGLSVGQMHRLPSRGWDRVNTQTLRLRGAPRTPEQLALAEVWRHADHAGLARQSAAWLWGTPGFELEPFHVLRRRNATERGGDRRHESRLVLDHHMVVHRGVPVTTPSRTIFDLAGCCHPRRVERALDSMWAAGLLRPHDLGAIVDELAQRGRRGSGLMRELASARGVEFRPVESGLERRFVEILKAGQAEPFDRQVELGDDEGPIGRVDFLDRSRSLIVETDSIRFHSSPSDRAQDARRDLRMQAAGFAVLRIEEPELNDAVHVLARVASARSERDHRVDAG